MTEALEIMAYCLYDGKVDQQSEFETSLYNSLLDQMPEMKEGFIVFMSCCIKNTTWIFLKDIPGTALALIRMYLQVLGKPGERMFKEVSCSQMITKPACNVAVKFLQANLVLHPKRFQKRNHFTFVERWWRQERISHENGECCKNAFQWWTTNLWVDQSYFSKG